MSEKNLVAWLAGRRDIPNLSKYIRHAGVSGSDDKKLKRLAERVSPMTQREQWIFSGALDAESITGLDDVLRVADHLKDYELIPEVSTDREPGGYLVEHDLLGVEFPQEVRPYLDYVAIGAEYYSSHGGAYTPHAQLRRRQEESGLALGPYMTQLIEKFYKMEEKTMAKDNQRTVAFQVDAELFERFKEYLKAHGVKQNAFFLDCIQLALGEVGAEQ